MTDGHWIEPPDPNLAGEWWLTRRSADSAPGFDLGLPDFRAAYRWDDGHLGGAWTDDGPSPRWFCLNTNNGWRIEGRVDG